MQLWEGPAGPETGPAPLLPGWQPALASGESPGLGSCPRPRPASGAADPALRGAPGAGPVSAVTRGLRATPGSAPAPSEPRVHPGFLVSMFHQACL